MCRGTWWYLRKRPLKAVYFTSSQELTQPRCIHKMKGGGNCYFRAISFILTGDEKNHLVVRGRSSCLAYGKCRNWCETWGLSRQNRCRLPEELPMAYKILIMQENKKCKTWNVYLEIDRPSNSRTGRISCVRFTEFRKAKRSWKSCDASVTRCYDFIWL